MNGDIPSLARDIAMTDTLHVMPIDDLVEHTTDPDCVCGPRCEPVMREDGSNGWVYTHPSLDGRELSEA